MMTLTIKNVDYVLYIQVMDELKASTTAKYKKQNIENGRFPYHVWSQLSSALQGLVVKRAGYCWQVLIILDRAIP